MTNLKKKEPTGVKSSWVCASKIQVWQKLSEAEQNDINALKERFGAITFISGKVLK